MLTFSALNIAECDATVGSGRRFKKVSFGECRRLLAAQKIDQFDQLTDHFLPVQPGHQKIVCSAKERKVQEVTALLPKHGCFFYYILFLMYMYVYVCFCATPPFYTINSTQHNKK